MGRYGMVGRFGQVAHPRIRGALDPSHEQKHYSKLARLEDYRTDEETYFVPSFSIRRHLHRDEELLWSTNQKLIQRRLGRTFTANAVDTISIKTVEQQKVVRNMRKAGIHPEPEQIRDIAYGIRDRLTDLLSNARSPLFVELGDISKIGYRESSLAYMIEGWKGDRAHYGENDEEGFMDTRAVLLAERQLAVGALALAYGEAGLDTTDLAPCPHVTIARTRSKDSIPDYRMRALQGELGDLAIDGAYFGDPIISVRLHPGEPAETIPVKHAWDSLAPEVPQYLQETAVPFELEDDRYEVLAAQFSYA